MDMDFNSAGPQQSFETIPEDTVVMVHLNIRPGSVGQGGFLRRSNAGDSEQLDCEFIVVDGPYAKRKFWTLMTVNGETDGQKKAVSITRDKIRAIIESAHGILPTDDSPEAKAKRSLKSWEELDGLRFMAKVKLEPESKDPKSGRVYKAKNTLGEVITPDKQAWTKPEQLTNRATVTAMGQQIAQTAAFQNSVAKAGISKPQWAR
jgi:hypothetical protein